MSAAGPVPPVSAALIARALAAQARAYAPYSKFAVGAAIDMGGVVFEGVNVENASYPLCVCAERTAIGVAVAAGQRELRAVAVATSASPPSSPCGACRQVLLEFAADPAANVAYLAAYPAAYLAADPAAFSAATAFSAFLHSTRNSSDNIGSSEMI